MNRPRAGLLCVVAALCLVVEAVATQVFSKPLDQVLSLGGPVIKAVVVSQKVERGQAELRVHLVLNDVKVMRGAQSLQALERTTHSYSTLFERRDSHRRSMRVSPLRDGSGIETELVPGRAYVLLLGPDPSTLLRAEPGDCEANIRALLSGESPQSR